MINIDIYFEDLTSEMQDMLLKMSGISDPKEMNWDVLPLTVFFIPERDE